MNSKRNHITFVVNLVIHICYKKNIELESLAADNAWSFISSKDIETLKCWLKYIERTRNDQTVNGIERYEMSQS